jgi:hypothetical protein
VSIGKVALAVKGPLPNFVEQIICAAMARPPAAVLAACTVSVRVACGLSTVWRFFMACHPWRPPFGPLLRNVNNGSQLFFCLA